MPTPAFLSRGSTFWVGDAASPEVFTKIARIVSATPSGATRADVDVTNADTTGTSHEFISGSTDEGTWDIVANWIPDNATQDHLTGVNYAFRQGLQRNYRSVYNTVPAAGETFAGIITKYQKPPIDVNDAPLQVMFTLRVSGQPVPFITTP